MVKIKSNCRGAQGATTLTKIIFRITTLSQNNDIKHDDTQHNNSLPL